MNAQIKDGGWAFPMSGGHVENGQWVNPEYPGMTLRDYFADGANRSGACPYNQHEHEKCSEWAYSRADAMLAAREVQS